MSAASGFPSSRDPRTGRERANRPRPCNAPGCGRLVEWIVMPSGKLNLIEVDPDPTYGDVLIVEREYHGQKWRVGVTVHDHGLRDELRDFFGVKLHRSHFDDQACAGNADRLPRERADLA